MNDALASRARAVITSKEIGYFSTHGLGEVLAGIGAAHDSAAIRALTMRLIKDEEYGLTDAIASGLREAASGDDEFVQMVSDAAGMVRNDFAAGPVIDALVSVGQANPDAAAHVAEGLVDSGDADYAACLIGGAYAEATEWCDGMVGSLASSSNPAHVAASLTALRTAHIVHGAPDARRIADAVRDALRVDDDEVHCEAMEALLEIHVSDKERTAPMIRELAMRRHVCKPILATWISLDPPLSDDECVEYLDMCIEGVSASDRGVVYGAYRSLKRLARSHPDKAARILTKLAERGAYVGNWADLVVGEMGKEHPETALGAILSLLRLVPMSDMEAYLPSMVQHAARFSDPTSISKPLLAAVESKPEMSRRCRMALAELAVES